MIRFLNDDKKPKPLPLCRPSGGRGSWLREWRQVIAHARAAFSAKEVL